MFCYIYTVVKLVASSMLFDMGRLGVVAKIFSIRNLALTELRFSFLENLKLCTVPVFSHFANQCFTTCSSLKRS